MLQFLTAPIHFLWLFVAFYAVSCQGPAPGNQPAKYPQAGASGLSPDTIHDMLTRPAKEAEHSHESPGDRPSDPVSQLPPSEPVDDSAEEGSGIHAKATDTQTAVSPPQQVLPGEVEQATVLPTIEDKVNTGTGLEAFFNAADAFLKTYTADGKVAYEKILQNRPALNELLQSIATADLAHTGADQKLAFYINAYNLLTIQGVLEHYPLKSPLDVEGFFTEFRYRVAGDMLTLSQLENDILRPDPRIHFVLVCAAKGCPPILSGAFYPATVQEQLEERTRFAINDRQFIRIDQEQKVAAISEIFKWYEEDFDAAGGIRDYINRYRKEPIPPDYSMSYYPYDWSLNKQ